MSSGEAGRYCGEVENEETRSKEEICQERSYHHGRNQHRAKDIDIQHWELRVDLRKKLVFPDIVTTTLRPHMVGEDSGFIELTVP